MNNINAEKMNEEKKKLNKGLNKEFNKELNNPRVNEENPGEPAGQQEDDGGELERELELESNSPYEPS